jgi:DNA-directed RNA polymerase specialized sigma subunit
VANFVRGEEHDKLESKYALTTIKGVDRLLKDTHNLRSRAVERGEMAAVDILIDMELAISKAKLTERQQETVDLLYEYDLEGKRAAELMGIDSSTLSRNKQAALKKIVRVYKDWNYQ